MIWSLVLGAAVVAFLFVQWRLAEHEVRGWRELFEQARERERAAAAEAWTASRTTPCRRKGDVQPL